ncbi:MAG: glutamate 5-kinase [Micavibrio sp.]|nr:glutamate 5-kinase [Micavibrio sp.]|tara:strand:- start:1637 stop:2785 length:1149 start_codon:yes stop_codon:yes gene_type:complete
MSADAHDIISRSKRIVIKIGSALVAESDSGRVKQGWVNQFAVNIENLCKQGKEIIIVSSGGVALGRTTIGIEPGTPPQKIPLAMKQASSAVGQFHLFNSYYTAFSALNMNVAQVLLTMSETENRRMHLNARETLYTLLERSIVPIINENDTVSTAEIRFGENDSLAVRVAQMVSADLVILLSTADGLYTDNPDTNPEAKHIAVIDKITEDHIKMAGDALPGLSTGGMKSKVQAAMSANQAGISLIIAEGRPSNALNQLATDKTCRSTLFYAQETKSNARKRWIQSHIRPKGKVIIDQGAVKALLSGKSLLPIGVKSVQGDFKRGDAITVHNEEMTHIATGLVAYNAANASALTGKSSADIEDILGYAGRSELIHRDDLVLIT